MWLYSSLLIALLLNSAKLLALRENGIVAHYWHFNAAELGFQFAVQFGFCYLLFYLNLKDGWLTDYRDRNKYLPYFIYNITLSFFCMVVCGGIQKRIFAFNDGQLKGAFWAGYFTRFSLTVILVGIIIKLILLMRQTKEQALENERLKNAYTTAELELLKEQLNPHFLFNSLSSLSGVVRENPALAQQYIKHLSSVFRYTLVKPSAHLVTVAEELTMVKSFAQLLKMRFENAFDLKIEVDEKYLNYKVPHLSLQPLLENAAKHNAATLKSPLTVTVNVIWDQLTVSNNLNPVEAEGTGTGLANLSQRFKILLHRDIEILKTADQFIVKLPLLHE
ncbi:sensor histidine kinase [Mucilaginibacter flavus]|uniref:sensor histidine kinase n=1 Tax=Mucilaginibacter flavus TaxID=931504 RepID=UPI0025B543AA|nr:histidine kinase [Mucilaginibacter flavus]MDN3581029.1 histidine kinase [Mucilaginibacter flavus]